MEWEMWIAQSDDKVSLHHLQFTISHSESFGVSIRTCSWIAVSWFHIVVKKRIYSAENGNGNLKMEFAVILLVRKFSIFTLYLKNALTLKMSLKKLGESVGGAAVVVVFEEFPACWFPEDCLRIWKREKEIEYARRRRKVEN